MEACPPNFQLEVINLHCNDMLKGIKYQEKQLLKFCKCLPGNKYAQLKVYAWGFPGGSVIRSLLANVGDRVQSLIQEDKAHTQLLSLCSRVWEPKLLSPHATTTEASTTTEAIAMRNPPTKSRVSVALRN